MRKYTMFIHYRCISAMLYNYIVENSVFVCAFQFFSQTKYITMNNLKQNRSIFFFNSGEVKTVNLQTGKHQLNVQTKIMFSYLVSFKVFNYDLLNTYSHWFAFLLHGRSRTCLSEFCVSLYIVCSWSWVLNPLFIKSFWSIGQGLSSLSNKIIG